MKIELRVGDSIAIGSVAVIKLEDKSGKVARLSIQADKAIPINRIARQSDAQLAASTGLASK